MWWAAAIQVGMSLFGASKQKKAGRQARKIAEKNIQSSKIETAETLRRKAKQDAFQEGYARTVAAGSGFSQQAGTGQVGYIDAMIAENTRQSAFIEKAAKREQEILRLGGKRAQTTANAAVLNSLSNAAGQAGKMWSSPNAPWNG